MKKRKVMDTHKKLAEICDKLKTRGYINMYDVSMDNNDKSLNIYCVQTDLRTQITTIVLQMHNCERQNVIEKLTHTIGQPYVQIVVYPNNTASYWYAKYPRPGKIYYSKYLKRPAISIDDGGESVPELVPCESLEQAFAEANAQIDKFEAIADSFVEVKRKTQRIYEDVRNKLAEISAWQSAEIDRVRNTAKEKMRAIETEYANQIKALV